MGRKKRWDENILARFAVGKTKEIDTVRDTAEDRTDFIREAVDLLIAKRKRQLRQEASK